MIEKRKGKLLAFRKHNLKRKFNLTLEDYEKLHRLQEGLCAICKQPEVTKLLAVDHNHETGEIRGLLCIKCNNGLGCFKDNVDLLDKAKEYLACR